MWFFLRKNLVFKEVGDLLDRSRSAGLFSCMMWQA